MSAEKILNFIRQLGFYACLCAVVIAVLNGIINRQFWAPFYVSIACWIGLIVWMTGFLGLKIKKKLSSRLADHTGA